MNTCRVEHSQLEVQIVEGINRILEATVAASSEEELGQVCIEVALQVTGSEYGFIGELCDDGFVHDNAMSGMAWSACATENMSGHTGRLREVRGLYAEVMLRQASLIANDPLSHPASIGIPEGHPPLESFLGVPLVENGRTLGVLAAANRPDGYQPEQQQVVEALAPAIVQAFQRKRAELDLRRSEEKYRLLFDSIDEGFFVIDVVFDEHDRPVDMYYVEANAAATATLGADFTGKRLREIGRAYEEYWYEIFGNVALTGESVRIERYAEPDDRWYSSYLFRIGGPDSRRIGDIFLDITGRKRRELYSQALNELGARITSSLQTNEILASVVELAGRTIGADCAVIYVLDGEAFSASFGWHEPEWLRGHKVGEAEIPFSDQAAEEREVLLFDEPSEHPLWEGSIAQRVGAQQILDGPLLAGDKVIGDLVFYKTGNHQRWTQGEVDFVRKVSASISLGLRNAQLYEQRGRQATYAQALNRIDAAIHASLQSDEIMQQIVVQVTEALAVDGSAVHMHQGGYWEFAYSHGLPEELATRRLSDHDAPLSMRVVETSEPIIANDVLHDDRANVRLMAHFGITALIAVPLVVHGEVIGVLFAGCRDDTRKEFTDEHVDFASKVASTLALALQNAQLYESEHRIATQLQEALLALPDEISGVELAHAYHSATETARVGGDFYDVFEISNHFVGITVGDVAGKGVDAAVLTSLAKNTIRAHAIERGKTPADILRLTNEVLYRTTTAETFVTLFFGVLDCRDGRLIYANAGHTDATVVRAACAPTQLSVTAPLLGAFSEAEFRDAEAFLDLDEVLFLYTDGLTEARSPAGEFYGDERLVSFLSETRDASPTGIIGGVISDVLAFSGGRLADDLAVLAVRRVEYPAETPKPQKLEIDGRI